MNIWSRAVLGLIVGAIAGAAALSVAYARTAALDVQMDRSPAPIIGGLYDVERVGGDSYAWSSAQVTMRLPGLDRRVPWACVIRLRGPHPGGESPEIITSVDGAFVDRRRTTPDYQDLNVAAPARNTSGLIVGLTISPTFVPGPQDRRSLGVMIDRWTCAPDGGAFVWPPRRAMVVAALAGGIFGATFAVLAATALGALLGALLLAGLQAAPIAMDAAVFSTYPDHLPWLALWTGGLIAAVVLIAERLQRRQWHDAARFVAAVTAACLYLKLLVVLHPAKAIGDALFHAHRLQAVLAGHFYFTQRMPSGVEFPYAIGLYVFAAPWAALTHDHVLLLRVIVSAAEATGMLLLYLLAARVWRDPIAGAAAAVLFALVPRSFEIIGFANMTNAFGQAVALAAVSAAVLWPLRGAAQVAGLTLLTAFALLCHVSTFALLAATLFIFAALCWTAREPSLRASARAIVIATLLAIVIAIAVYYGHFAAAYESAAHVAQPAAAAAAAPPSAIAAKEPVTFFGKAGQALLLSEQAVDWPLLLLAIPGAVWLWRRRPVDRFGLLVAAWLLTWAGFTLIVMLLPVKQSFQRYAAEFITRVTLATDPAIVVLAGAGVSWAWRSGRVWRVAVVPVAAAACYIGVRLWIGWI